VVCSVGKTRTTSGFEMHLPDGFVSLPINGINALISATAVAFSLRQARRALDERLVPLLGVTTAFVFAAQMVNFPVAAGVSGHLMGGVLAGMVLGPWLSCLVMAVVLIIQALMFADGGITALGSNMATMGIVGGLLSTALLQLFLRILPKRRPFFIFSVALVSWGSVVAASAVCACFLALSGAAPMAVILPTMVGVHALIGIGEALITCSVAGFLLLVRSDLLRLPGGYRRLGMEGAPQI
jgi:cobalt/nickel transport system permease protein